MDQQEVKILLLGNEKVGKTTFLSYALISCSSLRHVLLRGSGVCGTKTKGQTGGSARVKRAIQQRAR
jgi:hypothetical protein